MHIALLTPYLPAPANTGGRIRMHRLARALAARADVALYACAGAREAAALAQSAELSLYSRVRVRNSDAGAVRPFITARRVRRSCPAALARQLAADHARRPFDALVVAHSYAAALARAVPEVPLVLDEHNIESEYAQQYATAMHARSGALRRELELLRAWELRAWSAATLVTCVCERDAARVQAARGCGPVRVVPNGAALEALPFIPPSARASSREVLFVGLLSHAPNVAAALFLAHEVMPLVWRARPDARLVLCGRAPAPAIARLAGPRIAVTGTVPSVAPYLARASVYANPLFHGAGSSLKVPEALASGVPLVSTAIGVRGYPLGAGEHYAPAEDAPSFAHAVLTALQEPGAFDTQAARARAVAERYAWEAIAAEFASHVEHAVRGAA